MTTNISISSQTLDCNKIINLLNVSCKIIPTKTKICKNKHCHYEKGCDITITEPHDIKKVWNTLRSNTDINCAYLHIHGQYKGCILDHLRESACK